MGDNPFGAKKMMQTETRQLEHVLMTGAATGIGRSCALKLHKQGVRICALDIVEPDYPVDSYCKLDLSQADSIDNAIEFARKQAPFDALLNIAGVPPRPELQPKILMINWLGQVQLTKGVLNRIRAGGAIVNMASKAGAKWQDNIDEVRRLMSVDLPEQLDEFIIATGIDATRAYNLSKEAIIVWTLSSAQRLKEKSIRMNSVSPAAVETAILGDFKTAFGARVEKNLALVGRPGQPDEIADVTLFLASPGSNWIHGVDVSVDGGMGAMLQSEALGLDAFSV